MYEYLFFFTYKLPGYHFQYNLSLNYHKVLLQPDHFKLLMKKVILILLMYKVIVIQNSDMEFEIPSPLSWHKLWFALKMEKSMLHSLIYPFSNDKKSTRKLNSLSVTIFWSSSAERRSNFLKFNNLHLT